MAVAESPESSCDVYVQKHDSEMEQDLLTYRSLIVGAGPAG